MLCVMYLCVGVCRLWLDLLEVCMVGFFSFCEFYLFYLGEYSNCVCCCLYFVGSLCVLVIVIVVIVSGCLVWFWLVLVVGYGFVWVGYFVFEKNCLVMFCYLLYSLVGDWVMFVDVLCGWVWL